MDPDRKRKIRLVVALSAAVLLAVALIYTSFSASTSAKEPSEVIAAGPNGDASQVTGEVVSSKRVGAGLHFVMQDRDGGGKTLPVDYTGQIPDPFRDGREVIVTGTLNESGVLVAQKDSLITKCPSKFSDEAEQDPEHVVISNDQ
jgi:cytochrome c-type biogenesis protein CcmE